MVRAGAFTAVFLVGALGVVSSLDCQQICSEIRDELKPGIACRNHRKILPRPKVGNACMSAYWEGFTDSCFASCSGDQPTSMVSSVCRSARSEMPKPMVYRSCETGYNTGFGEAAGKVVEELRRRKDAPSAEEMAKIKQEEEAAKTAQAAAAKEAREAGRALGTGGVACHRVRARAARQRCCRMASLAARVASACARARHSAIPVAPIWCAQHFYI